MARKKWGLARTFPLMLIGAIVVGFVTVGISSYLQREGLLAASTAVVRPETLVGEPCPSLTKAEYEARPTKAKQAFISNDIRYERRYGHVECSVIAAADNGTAFVPVCQFTGPALLTVTTVKRAFCSRQASASRPRSRLATACRAARWRRISRRPAEFRVRSRR